MSQIVMFDKIKDDFEYAYFQHEIEKQGTKYICQGEINREFLEESLDQSDYLFVHLFNNEIRGIACVYVDETPEKHLYVNLICNAKFHTMRTRLTGADKRVGGRNMIDEIKQLGEKLRVKYIKLNAIDNVISYYYSLGFTFENSKLQREIEVQHHLITKLRTSQLKKNEYDEGRLLDDIVGKFYPGFYNETFQRKIGEGDEDRKLMAREDGIPMILHLYKTGGKMRRKTNKKHYKTQMRRRRNKQSRTTKKVYTKKTKTKMI